MNVSPATNAPPAHLRPLQPGDREIVFRWRNSDEIRQFMFNTAPISWEDHCRWFERTCEGRSKTTFLIFEWYGTPLGAVYFTNLQDGKHWGFYLAPGQHGAGIGSIMGFMGLDLAFRRLNAKQIIGEVLEFNDRSIEFHRKLGFSQCDVREDCVDGSSRKVLIFRLVAQEWAANRDAVKNRVTKTRTELSWLI